MDFTPSEEAVDVAALAADICARLCTAERVAELESSDASLDTELWRTLAEAGLLSLASPDTGLSALETTTVSTELGRALARVPYVQHAVAAIPLLAEHGSDALSADLLSAACSGAAIVTAAFEEDLGTDLTFPTAALVPGDDGLLLSGVKVNVPYAAAATALLVTAVGPDGPVVTVVPTSAAGVTIVSTPSTGLTPVYEVELTDVRLTDDDVLRGGPGTVARAADLLRLGVAADQAGVVGGALDATASYAHEREQFGRAIGSFQAVAQRLADAYIDSSALSLTTTQAAWLTSSGASAGEIAAAVATAKFWAAEAGHRVAHTTVHVHGGVGLDTSHPAHRFFLRAKQNEFTYGSAPVVLEQIGAVLAH